MTLLIRSASSARLEIVGNDTTLKPIYVGDFKEFGLVTIRNNTTLKPIRRVVLDGAGFGYHQKQHNSQTHPPRCT